MKEISVAVPDFLGNEKKYVNECLDTVWISSAGQFIQKFENKFAEYLGVNRALSCCNGTVALHLALLALDVKAGDEIIVPSLTYIASANAAVYCNAKPVFIDSEYLTWNIDPQKIESKITPKTKAIMVVHLYGHPVDMDPIIDIARKHNLYIIEDAAEAIGAKYKGKFVGSMGDIATFSFYGNKIITTGEGGMIVTNNNVIAEKVKVLKSQGMDTQKRYWFPMVGYNYRMTNVQAAIGLAQLENIDLHLNKRRQVAQSYFKYLQDLTNFIEFHHEQSWASHVYWMFSIRLKNQFAQKRDQLMQYLMSVGIETRPVFYPMHHMPPYFDSTEKYPVADDISASGINLPTHGKLSEEDIQYIAKHLKLFFNKE